MDQALTLSAQATEAQRSGRVDEAVCLQRASLDIKSRSCGENSVQAALSFNELGVLRLHDLEAAEHALTKALRVRDDVALEAWGSVHGNCRNLRRQLHLHRSNCVFELGDGEMYTVQVQAAFGCARFDAAVSREYFVQLQEAQGHFLQARTLRKRGVQKQEMACGNNQVDLYP